MYNTLHVPLDIGTWLCMLVPRNQYHASHPEIRRMRERRRLDSRSRGNRNDTSRISRDQATGWSGPDADGRAEEQRQRDEDRRAFDLYFRPKWDLHSITGAAALSEIRAFLGELLHVAHMSLPTDNASIERTLRRAVEDGRLVPFVNRNRVVTSSTYRPTPAPPSWPPIGTRAGRMQPIHHGLKAATAGGGLKTHVAPAAALGSVIDTATGDVTNMGGEFDRLGMAEAAPAGPIAMSLGDAQPFELLPDLSDGVPFDVAKTPNTGEPGAWYINPGSGQMRLFGHDGRPVVDLDFDHFHNGLKPHAHNWSGSVRDGGSNVVPFSPWNP